MLTMRDRCINRILELFADGYDELGPLSSDEMDYDHLRWVCRMVDYETLLQTLDAQLCQYYR